MFKLPDDIANKPLSQHFLEHLLIDLAIAPAERLMILLQTQPELTTSSDIPAERVKHYGIKHYTNQIMKQEGILGFWKGCSFEILKNGTFRIFHSMFLHLYEPLMNVDDPSRKEFKTYFRQFLLFCAVEASLQILQHPFKVIRVRLAALESSSDPHAPRGFKRVGECIKRIWKEDGWRGFYRGLGTSILEAFASAINVTAQRWIAYKYVVEEDENVSMLESMGDVLRERNLGSIISAIFSIQSVRRKLKVISFQLAKHLSNLAILYPFRVIQRRIIMHKGGWRVKRTSVRQMIRDTWRREGLIGFYAGAHMQVMISLGETIISPGVSAIAGAVLPEKIKAIANVGDVNQGTEAALSDIKDTAGEIAGKATERVEDITEAAKEQVGKLAERATQGKK